MAPRVFLEGSLGAASFFERVEVWINGLEVRQEKMGLWGYLYQTFNRVFMDKEHRIKKYGRDFPRLSVSTENHIAADGKVHDLLSAAMGSLQFDAKDSAADKVLRFGQDGIWPFDSGSNICAALTGQETTNGYLPPEMDLTIRIHRRKPFGVLVQRNGIEDTDMYHITRVITAHTADEVVEWDLKDLCLQYEVLTTDAKTMASMKSRTQYFVDVPRVSIDLVTPGEMFSSNTINIPPGAKFVAIAWVFSDHVFHKSTSNRPLSPRFHFPPLSALARRR